MHQLYIYKAIRYYSQTIGMYLSNKYLPINYKHFDYGFDISLFFIDHFPTQAVEVP